MDQKKKRQVGNYHVWLPKRKICSYNCGQNVLVSHSEPFIYVIKKLLKALSDKEAVAQSEVDAFMENCAKRWQTREGTYQLMRRRLPDVRDLPEYPGADIDMEDI